MTVGDHELSLWDPATGTLSARTELRDPAECAALSADGRRAAVGRSRRLAVNVGPGGSDAPTEHGENVAEIFRIIPGPPPLGATAARRTLEIHREPHRFAHDEPVNAVALSPDGRLLAVGTGGDVLGPAKPSGGVSLWDTATGARLAFCPSHSGGVTSLAFSRDGMTLAAGTRGRIDPTAGLVEPQILVLNGKTLGARSPLRVPGRRGSVGSLAFSPDGATLAVATLANEATLVDCLTGAERRVLGGHTDTIRCVAFSPDGRTVATGGQDRTARLWDIASAAPRHVLSDPAVGTVESLAFSPDGKTLATASAAGGLRLWDVRTGKPARP
jgi:WD40 repeat protein